MSRAPRYTIDFDFMPAFIRNHGSKFVMACVEKQAAFICSLFNHVSNLICGTEKYTEDQFAVNSYRLSDGQYLLYIELPPDDEAMVYCTAYAIAFRATPDSVSDVVMYTVEQGMMGTTCIGRMTEQGHMNYGSAHAAREENVEAIRRLLES